MAAQGLAGSGPCSRQQCQAETQRGLILPRKTCRRGALPGQTSPRKSQLGFSLTIVCCLDWTPTAKLSHLKIIQRQKGILTGPKREEDQGKWTPHPPAGPAPQTQSSCSDRRL